MTADSDARRDTRKAFADTLSEFTEQQAWYGEKASLFKSRAQGIDIAIIAFGAIIAVLPILKPGGAPHWTVIVASFLGALVAIGQAFQRVFRYGETWPEYRQASERMKREWRLFVNGAEPYDGPEEAARRLYVSRLEAIIAEEQKIFFERRRDRTAEEAKETTDDS